MHPLKPRNARASTVASTVALLATLFPFGTALAVDANAGIKAKVDAAFADAPVMVSVAKCESGFRQFAPDGTVLRGGSGKGYIGIFQIGERLHAARAATNGEDIFTIDGNIAYARRLYDERGAAPWRECIPTTTPATMAAPQTQAAPTAQPSLIADLKLGSSGTQVKLLQQLLNAKGFTVATSGPGAPGNESDLFGLRTRDAVRRFQCAQKIACEGTETTTGYGRVGPKTRAQLLLPTPL